VLVVWMVRESRRSLHGWSRPVVVYPVFAVLLLTAIGGAYQAIASTSSTPMAGQLVDVGGYRMHINCTGTGSPTVVLEPGLGEPGAVMAGWIQPAVATTTKVCVYDRAGKGFSDNPPKPLDGRATAAALHTLLTNAHVPGPYVLVGHSSGGVYVRNFAAQYPDQVAGVVFLDSQPSEALTGGLPDYPVEYWMLRHTFALMPSLARLGLMRLDYQTQAGGLPPAARAEERADWSTASHTRALHDELAELRTALTQSQALTTLGDKPLIVVSAGKGATNGWMPLQDKLAALSTNSAHRIAPDATHASLPEDKSRAVGVSARAVLDVVASIRTGTPLTS
jgi:pimeloyl-ACP methyl ester carboxylesterase